jgi:hypothetical protein
MPLSRRLPQTVAQGRSAGKVTLTPSIRRKVPKQEVRSDNVFADVGMPDAELHLPKAEIVDRTEQRAS